MEVTASLDTKRTVQLDSFPYHTRTSSLQKITGLSLKILLITQPFNDIHNPKTILRLLKHTVEWAEQESIEKGLIKYLYK